MDNKTLEHCKIVTNTPKYWDPMEELFSNLIEEDLNRLVYADDQNKAKELQGRIKLLRFLLTLPDEVYRLETEKVTSHR
jgi:hypothetical protein